MSTKEETGRLILQASTGAHGNVAKKLADALAAHLATTTPGEPAEPLSDAEKATQALQAGLLVHAAKFIDPAANALPESSDERDHFMIEVALRHGFEMIDDDGDVYVCNSRQIVSLVSAFIASAKPAEAQSNAEQAPIPQ